MGGADHFATELLEQKKQKYCYCMEGKERGRKTTNKVKMRLEKHEGGDAWLGIPAV